MSIEEFASEGAGLIIPKNSPWIGLTLKDICQEYKVIINGYRGKEDYELKAYNPDVKVKPDIYIEVKGSEESIRKIFAMHAGSTKN